ncbi:MAG: hypothetical protein U0V04_20010 [Spirosomataceae bacterium]|jgi:hypothetical protein
MRKDWDNLSDEAFDDWIKSGAGSHSEPLWEGAWEAMESKLDEKKERKIIPFWWRSAAAILIFGVIGGYFYLKSDSKSDLADYTGVLKNDLGKLEKAKSTKNSEIKILENKSLNQKEFKEYQSFENTGIKNKIAKTRSQQFLKNQKSNYIASEINSSEKNEIRNPSEGLVSDEQNVVKILGNTSVDSAVLQKEIAIVKTDINTTNEVLIQTNTSLEMDSVTSISEEQFVENQQNNDRVRFSRWAFNLGASPDYSSVTFGQQEPIGYNIQVGLAFYITQKLQVKTALIRSLKLYEAYADDYAWPAKWGTPTSPLVDVGASCNMLDIPVSLTYFVARKNKNSYFTSLGITNYYMLKEKYEYHYVNDNDPNLKWKNWEGSTGFAANSVANISIGLQRKVSDKLSIQIEPFLKIPLKSIGFGNVKLYSAGLFFNVIPTNIFKSRNQK